MLIITIAETDNIYGYILSYYEQWNKAISKTLTVTGVAGSEVPPSL